MIVRHCSNLVVITRQFCIILAIYYFYLLPARILIILPTRISQMMVCVVSKMRERMNDLIDVNGCIYTTELAKGVLWRHPFGVVVSPLLIIY